MIQTGDSLTSRNTAKAVLDVLKTIALGAAGGVLVAAVAWWLTGTASPAAWLVKTLKLGEATPWYFVRSSGTVAYLLLTGATVWGLLLSTKIIADRVPAALSLAMHNVLSGLAIGLSVLHALALLLDHYYAFSLANLMIPFQGPYRPGWVGLGIVSWYLLLLVSVSFRFRKRMGQKAWRRLHYLSFAGFIMVTLHGVMAGTDAGNTGMQLIYWLSGLTVLFLTNYRLIAGKTAARRSA